MTEDVRVRRQGKQEANGKESSFWILLIFLSLFVGGAFYFFFCPDVWFVRQLNCLLGRDFQSSERMRMEIRLLRYYLPDALWAFAMTAAIRLILGNNTKTSRIGFLVSVLTGVVLEFLQFGQVISGTGDWMDILAEGTGALVCVFIINKYRRFETNEENR